MVVVLGAGGGGKTKNFTIMAKTDEKLKTMISNN